MGQPTLANGLTYAFTKPNSLPDKDRFAMNSSICWLTGRPVGYNYREYETADRRIM